MEKNNNEEEVETIENEIIFHIPDDIQKITGPPRESIYYLGSLKTLYQEHVAPPNLFNKQTFDKNIKRIDKCFEDFDRLENKIYYPQNPKRLPSGAYQLDLTLTELTLIAKDYILLKEKIDELQLDLLKYLFEVDQELISNLTSKEKYLEPLRISFMNQILTYSAFEHSKDEEKIDNYRLYINSEEDKQEFSKDNVHPIPVKVKNYDFLISKFRSLYKKTKHIQIQVINDSSRLREEEKFKEINVEQFRINKKIKLLTIITTILTVVGLIYASISTYYLLTDSTGQEQVENDKLNNQVLKRINSNIEDTNEKLDKLDLQIQENSLFINKADSIPDSK